jgi:hypothetical protein
MNAPVRSTLKEFRESNLPDSAALDLKGRLSYIVPASERISGFIPARVKKNIVASVKQCSILAPFVVDSPGLKL